MLSNLWGSFVDTVVSVSGNDPRWNLMICFFLVEIIFFMVPSLLFQIFEKQLQAYRIDKSAKPREELTISAFQEGLVNAFIAHPLIFVIIGKKVSGTITFTKELPNLFEIIAFHVFSCIANDILFYWTHRMFHEIPRLYKLHKKHHEFYATRGIAAQYAHLIEAIVCNTIPTLAGTIIWIAMFGSIHMTSFMIYFAIRLLETTEVHSGFVFPITTKILYPTHCIMSDYGHGVSEHHYFHHSANTGNYGIPITDYLFGTDKAYRKFVDSRRGVKNEKKA